MRPLGLMLGGGAVAAGLSGLLAPGLPLLAIFLVAAGVTGLGTLALPAGRAAASVTSAPHEEGVG